MRKYRLMSEMALLRLLLGIVFVFASMALSVRSARAQVLTCDVPTIQGVAPGDTTIVSAESKSSPVAYCDVKGAIATSTAGQNNSVIFELGLPDTWNGALLFLGNGGFAGSLKAVDNGGFAFNLNFGWA